MGPRARLGVFLRRLKQARELLLRLGAISCIALLQPLFLCRLAFGIASIVNERRSARCVTYLSLPHSCFEDQLPTLPDSDTFFSRQSVSSFSWTPARQALLRLGLNSISDPNRRESGIRRGGYEKEIAARIEKTYGVNYSVEGVTQLLHRLGFVYKKTKIVPGKVNPGLQRCFKRLYGLIKDMKEPEDRIYVLDGTRSQQQTLLRLDLQRRDKNKPRQLRTEKTQPQRGIKS
jgi:Winged helix-turn helix